jgi:hypothetical protein
MLRAHAAEIDAGFGPAILLRCITRWPGSPTTTYPSIQRKPNQRWEQGCRNATHLHTELTACGYKPGGPNLNRCSYQATLNILTPPDP